MGIEKTVSRSGDWSFRNNLEKLTTIHGFVIFKNFKQPHSVEK